MSKKKDSKDPDLEEIEILIDPTDPDYIDDLWNEEIDEEEEFFRQQDEELEEDWPYPDEDEPDSTPTCSLGLKMEGQPYYI